MTADVSYKLVTALLTNGHRLVCDKMIACPPLPHQHTHTQAGINRGVTDRFMKLSQVSGSLTGL